MNYTNPAEQEIINNMSFYARSIDNIIRTFESGGRFYNFKQFELLENAKNYMIGVSNFDMDEHIKSYGQYLINIINSIEIQSIFSR